MRYGRSQVPLVNVVSFFEACKSKEGIKELCSEYPNTSGTGRTLDFLYALGSELQEALRSDEYDIRVRPVCTPRMRRSSPVLANAHRLTMRPTEADVVRPACRSAGLARLFRERQR